MVSVLLLFAFLMSLVISVIERIIYDHHKKPRIDVSKERDHILDPDQVTTG